MSTKKNMIPAAALQAFGFNNEEVKVVAFGTGLINSTWQVQEKSKRYILQKINSNIFKRPADIAHNLSIIGRYLKQNEPGYLFVRPIETVSGKSLFFDQNDNSYYRLLPFVNGSHTIDVVTHPSQAYEAAKQFGKFTRLLNDLDIQQIKVTLPDFHNLSLRYQQFEEALERGNKERIQQSSSYIKALIAQKDIVATYKEIKNNSHFKLRVTHHDTKISNVLLDEHDNGLCVIDLDTVMPGYFISDVGDMMRTYLSPVSEEEKDFSRIEVRREYYDAIKAGYLSEMQEILSDEELQYFDYAGRFLVYMQALRFLTDHLNNDVYYGAKYEGHNYVRAGNQLRLLESLPNLATSRDRLS